MRKCAAVALLVTSVLVPVVDFAAPKVAAATRSSRLHRRAGGHARGVDRHRRHARRHGAGAGAIRLRAPDPRRRAAAGSGADAGPVAVQRRRARPARRRTRPGLRGQRLRVPVLHPPSSGCPVAASTGSADSRCRATRSIPAARSCWSTTSPRTPAITTAAIWRSAATGSCTSRSATPVPIRVVAPAPTTPPRTSACSTARSCASCRRPATRHRATRSAGRARRAAGYAATCRDADHAAARRSTPGGCATRSGSPSTPTPGRQRFFINDVGQGTREEVDEGGIGSNYGWPIREGSCPIGQNPPCAAADPAYTEPITDYRRAALGQVITGGAFVPNGHWPAEYDGGYLFADGGTGNMWLRRVERDDRLRHARSPPASAASPTWRSSRPATASRCTTRSPAAPVRKITIRRRRSLDPDPLAFVAVPPGNRVLDTRLPSAGAKPRAGQHRRATCRWESTRP